MPRFCALLSAAFLCVGVGLAKVQHVTTASLTGDQHSVSLRLGPGPLAWDSRVCFLFSGVTDLACWCADHYNRVLS